MHKNNKHKNGYDFETLINKNFELAPFVFINDHGNKTIDFSNPMAVKALNTALIKTYYNIDFWEFPNSNLCPPIPSRVEYIHLLNDVLKQSKISDNASVLDVGTGANCIYPLLGNTEYDWKFVGTDCNSEALRIANNIVTNNELNKKITFRKQNDSNHIFKGILKPEDAFAATLCNPPFYKSEHEANALTIKKLKGLNLDSNKIVRNFSGQANELWCKGGEKAFLHTYIYESSLHKSSAFWYTTLVANKANVKSMQKSLQKLGAQTIKVINFELGNKKSRVVAWTFLTDEEQKEWIK